MTALSTTIRGRRRAAFAVLVVAILAALVAAGCGDSADESTQAKELWKGPAANTTPMSDADAAAIDEAAEAALKKAGEDTPGMWLGVWDPEKGMHVGAYGKAVLPDTAAGVDDHGRIGSVTKTFTATAVLRLVDDGKLSLDDTVEDVLPDLAADYPDIAGITVEQLLGMTSGIPDYANLPLVIPAVVKDPSKVWTPEEIVTLVLEKEDLQPAGTAGYSTTNYLILGMMIEEKTGDTVEEALNAVAKDAGLTQTALAPAGDDVMPDPYSHGYVSNPGSSSIAELGVFVEPVVDVTEWTASWGGAGGGMYSTVEDLGAWAAGGFGTSQLTPATAERRLTGTAVPDALGEYGLGIIDFGDGWIGHYGQFLGWESIALYNTETGAVYSGLVNETGSLGPTLIPTLVAIDPALGALFM